LQAIVSAAQLLQLGEGRVALAGGAENIFPATEYFPVLPCRKNTSQALH